MNNKHFIILTLIFCQIALYSPVLAQNYALERTFMGHQAPVSYVAFRSEDNLLVSGDERGSIIFWDGLTGKILNRLDQHSAKVTHLEFSNKGRYLASASHDGTIKVYDLKRKKLRQVFQNSSTGAYQDVEGNEPTFCTFSPDDKFIYFGGYNLQILKGSIRKGETEGVYFNEEFGITCGMLSPNKKNLVFAAGGNVFFMNLKTNQIVRELHQSDEYEGYICEMAFMPRSGQLATWAVDGHIHYWNWRANERSNKVQATPQEGTSDLAFSEDGKLLVTGNFGGKTKLWQTETNKILQLLGKHTSEVVTFAFSKNAKYIVTGSQDNTVRLWKKPDPKRPKVKKMPKKTRDRKVKIKRLIKVTGRMVEIHLWDNYQIDGDTISVNINGNWIVNNYCLKGAPRILKIQLNPGDNYMIVHAHNLGSIPPNTIAVAIVQGEEEEVFTLKSDLDESAAIVLRSEN